MEGFSTRVCDRFAFDSIDGRKRKANPSRRTCRKGNKRCLWVASLPSESGKRGNFSATYWEALFFPRFNPATRRRYYVQRLGLSLLDGNIAWPRRDVVDLWLLQFRCVAAGLEVAGVSAAYG